METPEGTRGVGAYLFPRYATYQDVRRNLTLAAVVVLVLVAWFFLHAVLTLADQAAVLGTKEPSDSRIVESAKDAVALAALAAPLAVLFVHFLEIHQRVYDSYVVRWRKNFEGTEFVPLLLNESGHPRRGEVWRRIREDRPERYLRELYYEPYVDFADGRRVNRTLLERFHEAMTAYWLTQIVEITLVLLVVSSGVYWSVVPSESTRVLAAAGEVCALALVHILAIPARNRAERAIRAQAWFFINSQRGVLRAAVDAVISVLDRSREERSEASREELNALAAARSLVVDSS